MEKLKPKLRFSEFTTAWKVTSISELGNVITGTTPSTSNSNYYGGNNLFLSPADIDDTRFVFDTKTKLTDLGFSKTRTLKGNSVAFVCIGSTIGKIAQVKKEFSTNQQINSIEFNSEYSEDFNYYNLLNKSKQIKLLAGVQTVPQINKTDFSKIKLNIPSRKEQTKIADFIGAVDKQLDILNQKKEKLNIYKKGVMQQLFSQQLRFKDDIGNNFPDWEEKSLGKMLGYTQPNKFIVKATDYNDNFKTPVLTAGKSFLLGYTNEIDNIYKNIPCIIFDDFTTSSQFVDFEFKVKSSAMKILNTKSKDNIKFLFELINSIKFPTGDEHKRYWISEYSKISLLIPSFEEQNKIADFLSAIDKQIKKVSISIEKTKKYKKGLLQQMFV